MERLVGRYDLIEQVAQGKGRTLWRGHDVVLDRPVGVLVLDRDHPHAAAVRGAAQIAARVEHPAVLRVVDADLDDNRVLVVTRWLDGSTLADLLAAGPPAPAEAARIARAVAQALVAAGEEGVYHLVLDPRDVLITDHGVVLVGVGVRAALEGVHPEADAEQVDAWRLGAVLYAALTGRWPGRPCAGLPAAPAVAGRVARPRQVRAGVPLELDDIAWRALQPDEELPLNTPKKVADALDSADKPHPRSPDEPTPSMPWPVLGMGLVALLMLAGVLLLAWQIWQDQSRPDATAAPPTSTPSPSATASPSAPVETVIPIASVVAFDPAGDNEENDEQAAAAIDGDATTAWRTLTYASRDLGQLKPGVGLRLNLGGQQAVSGVELQLVGRGTDLQIWAERGDVRPPSENPLAGYRTLASVRGAGDELTLRFAPAVRTRAIVVWLTALPADGTGYRGGIAEVTLLS